MKARRSGKLHRTRDYRRVYSQGKWFENRWLVLRVLGPMAGEEAETDAGGRPERIRVGMSVGKAFGGAVARNRCKRLLRETCRHLLSRANKADRATLGAWDLVLIPKPFAKGANLADWEQAVRDLLVRAGIIQPKRPP